MQIKFTSAKERILWIGAGMVLLAIYSSLVFGGRLVNFLVDHTLLEQSTLFLFLFLILIFVFSGLKRQSKRIEYWMYAGVIAVLAMTLLRMDLTVAERSHIFEYSMLSVCIYEALIERNAKTNSISYPIVISIVSATSLGILDECLQFFIPYRVFDVFDIVFNGFASALGVFINVGVRFLSNLVRLKIKE